MSFHTDIHAATLANTFFRKDLHTTIRSQLVLMSVEPGDDIGLETHDLDQVLCFVAGSGEAIVAAERSAVAPGHVVFVPAGTQHNFVNTGREPLKLFTVYAPPEHAPGTVHRTKADALLAEAAEAAGANEATPGSAHARAAAAAAAVAVAAAASVPIPTIGSLIGRPT